MRRLAIVALGALGVLLALGVAGFFLLGQVDLGPFAARRASASLGRPVAIGALHVTPGRWIAVELRDARIDNLPGGTRPAMAAVDRLTAEIDVLSLLHGPAIVRTLRIDGLSVLLERAADGVRNWRFGPVKTPAGQPDRSWYPLLSDVQIERSEVVFRTSGATALVAKLDHASIATGAADQPVRLAIAGSYHGVPMRLDGDLQPIAVLRNAATPYGTDLRITSDDTTLEFKGTMTAPLDLDGAAGTVTLVAPTLGPLLAVAGTTSDLGLALRLSGPFEHQGPLWRLSGAAGALDDSVIEAATLRLNEGAEGRPDDIGVDLAFDRLDVNALLGPKIGKGRRGSGADADIPLDIEHAPDTLIEARLAARQLTYNAVQATDARLEAALTPGRVAVTNLSMTFAGARIQASGRIDAAERGGRVAADLTVGGVDVQALRRLLDIKSLPMAGRMEARVAVQSSGATLNAAVRTAQVSAVAAMTGGSIAREVIEMASTDMRLLFRSARGMTPLSCMLGVLEMRAGVGTVAPLRIRAATGTIAGHAIFDLNRRQLDMTIGSEAASTSSFALDIPVRISGPFAQPDVRPAQWSASGRALLAARDVTAAVPPGLRQFARSNPCLSGGSR